MPTRDHIPHPNFNPNTPRAGGAISAGEYREVKRLVQQLVTDYLTYGDETKIRLFKLKESIGPEFDESSEWREKEGAMQYWDEDSKLWKDSDPADERSTISDAFDLVWDKDDIVAAFWHKQAQQWVPINQRTVRAAVTCPDDNGDYPDTPGNPNKFPIKFVRLTYTRAIGYESPTVAYVDSGTPTPASASPDDFVMNLYEHGEADCDCSSNYIPCYTLLWTWNQNDRWFTYTCCHNDISSDISSSMSSSSSSSQGFSSSSSESSTSASSVSASSQSPPSESSVSVSSQSASSQSPSSQSSTSLSSQSSSSQSSTSQSSASSSSESSASSGSSGSSASSVSASASSGGSSESSQSSSGFTCVTVVSRVTFDGNTCTLTFCTTPICFPVGLGIVVGTESC